MRSCWCCCCNFLWLLLVLSKNCKKWFHSILLWDPRVLVVSRVVTVFHSHFLVWSGIGVWFFARGSRCSSLNVVGFLSSWDLPPVASLLSIVGFNSMELFSFSHIVEPFLRVQSHRNAESSRLYTSLYIFYTPVGWQTHQVCPPFSVGPVSPFHCLCVTFSTLIISFSDFSVCRPWSCLGP